MNKSPLPTFIRHGNADLAAILVSAFYFALTAVALELLTRAALVVNQGTANFTPRWPIFWASYTGLEIAAYIILIGCVVGALIAAFNSHTRVARILAFIGVLQVNALLNSFEIRSQQWDLWVWVSGFFVLLPNLHSSKGEGAREVFLTIFWGAQALALLIYTMSGLWKIAAAVEQLMQGEMSILNPLSPAVHIATSFLRLSQDAPSIFGPLIIEHPFVAWVPLLALVYLQIFSFWAAYKPNLHRLWAAGIIAMHIGIFLTLGVQFFNHVPILLILLAYSPFRNTSSTWRDILYDLPLIGATLRFAARSLHEAPRQ